jgi:hypothetical protein
VKTLALPLVHRFSKILGPWITLVHRPIGHETGTLGGPMVIR